ncbi:hypothetical protein B0T21DRAFT_369317 [Apiosordaria backusii]|uniref:Genetic interactor of prohibitins 3, mitochondrial n=1 Tax=Apiosordaria backusii TaxID=314023 RepID=A0AA40E8W8_9PEZI|nr:hypothetical protein B0T21DRAFT_369317 [Apiosordaria backusii]
MHIRPARSASSRWLGRVFNVERYSSTSELPLYLCPAFRSLSTVANAPRSRPSIPHLHQNAPCQFRQLRRLHEQPDTIEHTEDAPDTIVPLNEAPKKTLPPQCTGCGALSQTAVPDEPGYYDLSRKSVRQYLRLEETEGVVRPSKAQQEDIVKQALSGLDLDALAKSGIDLKSLLPRERYVPEKTERPETEKALLCERCHKLVHHQRGNSIYHPSLESIQETIEASPYKYNHVYHIIDAADFPMSLLPRLHSILDITLRTQNRRGGQPKYRRGRLIEMSFIVTRSDLLAPKKEQVDSMMPYIRETLRDTLGRVGQRVRLGNVHCVSANRGWWTKELKEDIWKRGGANWMVGKVNVGKSQLFEKVFPKGRMSDTTAVFLNKKKIAPVTVYPKAAIPFTEPGEEDEARNTLLPGLTLDTLSDLLPPPQPETLYPAMPIVSSLPGTTASPIRVPFGSGKGELIDLPGLSRGDIELFVRPECRASLIMKSRIVPEQQTIKPGQSLLVGGFIRITPRNVAPDEELVFLAYAFTPIEPHLTSTEKAIATQTQDENAPKVGNIALPGTGKKIQHAGAFQLRYDITKARSGPLTRKEAVGLKVEQLPYRVLGIDILIEGVGWVELAVQVRTRKLFDTSSSSSSPRPPATRPPSSDPFDILLAPPPDSSNVTESPATFDIRPPSSDPFDILVAPPTDSSNETQLPTWDIRPEPINAVVREPRKEKKKPKPTFTPRTEKMTDEEIKRDLWAAWDDQPSSSQQQENQQDDDDDDDDDWGRDEVTEEEENTGPEPIWPVIDVYSPEGKFIGYRRPLNAWMMNREKKSKAAKRSRPRRSMKGAKKNAKREGRW